MTIPVFAMKRESRAPLIVAIVLLLLPLLYVGSYLALVAPKTGVRHKGKYGDPITENYRAFPGQCESIFWPLERIDRHVWPDRWDRGVSIQ